MRYDMGLPGKRDTKKLAKTLLAIAIPCWKDDDKLHGF